jgi:hypothetical protein
MWSTKFKLALVVGSFLVAALIVVIMTTQRVGSSRPQTVPASRQAGMHSESRLFYPAGRAPNLALPDGRSERVLSVLNVDGRMKYGDFTWDDATVPPGPVWIRVDLKRQLLSVFRGGHEIGTAVILYGIRDKQSPEGTFPVLQKVADYHSVTYDAPMPYMLRLTADGVAIHGAEVRPGAATHGCIGVPKAFARRLFDEVKLGDPVVILKSADRI